MSKKIELDWDKIIFKTYKEDMDWEHAKLNEIITHLKLENSKGASKERLTEILEKLIQFTEAHFKHEETFFLGLENYQNRQEHKKVHDHILLDLDMYFEQFQKSGGKLSQRFIQFIENRLCSHIHVCSLDRNFGSISKAVQTQDSLESPWLSYFTLADDRIEEMENILPVSGLKFQSDPRNVK